MTPKTVKMIWHEAIVLGGLWRDMTRLELVKFILATFLGAAMMFCLRAYTNSGPSVISQRSPESMQIVARGLNVNVHIRHFEVRRPCVFSYAIRRAVRYVDDNPKKPMREVAFFREHDIGWSELGEQDYQLDLTLYRPLEGNGWFLLYERHDACGLFDDLFPEHGQGGPPMPMIVAAR